MDKLDASAVELINDSTFLNTKNEIIAFLSQELYKLAGDTKQNFKQSLDAVPKVSKGENLKGLPYLVLDYPRIFQKENVFAFRTLFWWGNYVSFTLHLKGEYLDSQFINPLLLNQEKDICIVSFSGDEWNHDLLSSDYIKLKDLDINSLDCLAIPFLKICYKMELDQVNKLKQHYTKYKEILLAPFYGNKL